MWDLSGALQRVAQQDITYIDMYVYIYRGGEKNCDGVSVGAPRFSQSHELHELKWAYFSGPNFMPKDCTEGFTSIAINGPGVEEVVIVSSDHADREKNMWQFTTNALELIEICLKRHRASKHPTI